MTEKTVNTKVREINLELDRLQEQADATMNNLCDRILEIGVMEEMGILLERP